MGNTVLDTDTYSTGSVVAVRIKPEGTSLKAWVNGTLEIDTKDPDPASRGVYPRARPERESVDRASVVSQKKVAFPDRGERAVLWPFGLRANSRFHRDLFRPRLVTVAYS